jgi:hypothetical protein
VPVSSAIRPRAPSRSCELLPVIASTERSVPLAVVSVVVAASAVRRRESVKAGTCVVRPLMPCTVWSSRPRSWSIGRAASLSRTSLTERLIDSRSAGTEGISG